MAADPTPQDSLMRTAVRLAASLDALAALAAHVRVETEGLAVDPQVRSILAQVAQELITDPHAVTASDGSPVIGMVRALLRQATDLVEHPDRAGGWTAVDEPLLQGMGRMSAAITDAFRVASSTLDGMGERLREPDGAFLDVGTGTGWLSIAMAGEFPGLRVVGIDIFEPALSLARRNVAAQGLEQRVELRQEDVTALGEESAYDVIWLPLPFLAAEVVPEVLRAVWPALRPGGWLLAGTFAGPDDALSQLLVDLRTVRSGGRAWRLDEIIDSVTAGGFSDAHEVSRTWAAPVRLYAGRKP